MPISSFRLYSPTPETSYNLEYVVSWWPDSDNPARMNVAFVSEMTDTRSVVQFPTAAFEAAYQNFLDLAI